MLLCMFCFFFILFYFIIIFFGACYLRERIYMSRVVMRYSRQSVFEEYGRRKVLVTPRPLEATFEVCLHVAKLFLKIRCLKMSTIEWTGKGSYIQRINLA